MRKLLCLILLLIFFVHADHFPMRDHVALKDIEYIQFTPAQIFSLKPMNAICKAVMPEGRDPSIFEDITFLCFSDAEREGFKLTNRSRVECLIDNSTNPMIVIDTPVRDNSCVLSPDLAPLTGEDAQFARDFARKYDWICVENDCSNFKITLYDVIANHLEFKSQIVHTKHTSSFWLLRDIVSFIWAHQ